MPLQHVFFKECRTKCSCYISNIVGYSIEIIMLWKYNAINKEGSYKHDTIIRAHRNKNIRQNVNRPIVGKMRRRVLLQ